MFEPSLEKIRKGSRDSKYEFVGELAQLICNSTLGNWIYAKGESPKLDSLLKYEQLLAAWKLFIDREPELDPVGLPRNLEELLRKWEK